MRGLEGKTAIVTGGSRGIGRAVVEELAGRGVRVAFSYLSRKAEAEELVARLEGAGRGCLALQADLADPASARELVEAASERFGSFDFLVNNAGIIRPITTPFMSDADFREVLDTNLTGTFYLTRLAVQTWLKHKRPGAIVCMASVAGLRGTAGQVNYAASKAGIIALARSLSREVAAHGIRVNTVAPGWIDTDQVASMPAERRQASLAEVPMGRIGRPEEVARATSFLLSDEASYITGAVLCVDGGLMA